MIINWLKTKLLPLIQKEEWVVRIFQRLDKLEQKAHSPLFDKTKLNEIHKRLEDLETKAFVEQFPKMKDYEGTD